MSRTINNSDNYRERMVKQIPSEVLGVYIAANGAILSMDSPPIWLQWVVFVICLAATPLWFIVYQQVKSVTQNVLAATAFVVWAMTIEGPFTTIPGYQVGYGAVLLMIYSGLAGPMVAKLIKQ